jgi:cation:H+ antiporter
MTDSLVRLIPILLGLAALWVGAGLVLHAAARMGSRTPRWELIVGLTLAAIAPVLPEIGISLAVAASEASAEAVSGLVLGTVLGSVLARSTFVLGCGGLLRVTRPQRPEATTRPPLVLGAVALVALLSIDGSLGPVDGGVLLTLGLVSLARGVRTRAAVRTGPGARHGLLPDPFVIVSGLIVAGLAGWLLAPRALTLSGAWGIDPMLVGLLVLGVGASLPELVLAVNAATRGERELSASSVLANGTLGLLVPLGLAALIRPMGVDRLALLLDLPALGIVILCLWAWDRRGAQVVGARAAALLGAFLVYVIARMASSWL